MTKTSLLDNTIKDCPTKDWARNAILIHGHHLNFSTLILHHNLFDQSVHNLRTISINCHVTMLLNSPRALSSIHCLARQCFPTNYKEFINLYHELCSKVPYGYILLEMSGETPIELKIRNNLFESEGFLTVYIFDRDIPKKQNEETNKKIFAPF